MTLSELGYDAFFGAHRQEQGLEGFAVGRVISEHRERYIVRTPDSEFDAELIGSLRYTAESRIDFPAVGDWVALSLYEENKALIHAVFPRKSVLQRRSVGKASETQILAANIDYALIVQAVDGDFNLNRLERYLTICLASEINPVIVLSKSDLISRHNLETRVSETAERIKNVPILAVSSTTGEGYLALRKLIRKGETYCLLGSSGAGKSTLLNALLGNARMETGKISESTGKGRHITTHRELVVVTNGGILVDNPGIREVGVTEGKEGVHNTFDELLRIAADCRFSDCTHTQEQGCAVLKALEERQLDEALYSNYIKIERERAHFATSLQDKRKQDKKMGKLYKRIQTERRQNKY